MWCAKHGTDNPACRCSEALFHSERTRQVTIPLEGQPTGIPWIQPELTVIIAKPANLQEIQFVATILALRGYETMIRMKAGYRAPLQRQGRPVQVILETNAPLKAVVPVLNYVIGE